MLLACISAFEKANITVCCAAVADYKPAAVSDKKIKKNSKKLELKLSPTTDILKTLGERKKNGQFLVGFALETDNILDYAADKLKKKNLDLIIANKAGEENSGFSSENNRISILDKHNKITNFELKPKVEVAQDIVDHILKNLH
jgi:phosphopantothenoylcysteine decarboxylase/phosphopantothenate--cysteine ligase